MRLFKIIITMFILTTIINCNSIKNKDIKIYNVTSNSISLKAYNWNDSTYHELKIIPTGKIVTYQDTSFIGLNIIYEKDTILKGNFYWDNGQIFTFWCFYKNDIPEDIPADIFDDLNSYEFNCGIDKVFDMDTSYFFYDDKNHFSPNMAISLGDIIPSNLYKGRFLNYKIQNFPFTEEYIEINMNKNYRIESITFRFKNGILKYPWEEL